MTSGSKLENSESKVEKVEGGEDMKEDGSGRESVGESVVVENNGDDVMSGTKRKREEETDGDKNENGNGNKNENGNDSKVDQIQVEEEQYYKRLCF